MWASDSGFTSLLASLSARMEPNRQNRQTVKGGNNTTRGKRKPRTQTRGKVWFGERRRWQSLRGNGCDGKLALTDTYGQTEVSSAGEWPVCVCLWESHHEGAELGGAGGTERSWAILQNISAWWDWAWKENKLEAWLLQHKPAAGRKDGYAGSETQQPLEWKQWWGSVHCSSWWLPAPHPDSPQTHAVHEVFRLASVGFNYEENSI